MTPSFWQWFHPATQKRGTAESDSIIRVREPQIKHGWKTTRLCSIARTAFYLLSIAGIPFTSANVLAATGVNIPVCWYHTSYFTVYCGSPYQAAEAFVNDENAMLHNGLSEEVWYINLSGDYLTVYVYVYPGGYPGGYVQLRPICPSGYVSDGLTCSPDGSVNLQKEKQPQCNAETTTPGVGNPCDARTGNKYAIETDYQGVESSRLVYRRSYNSISSQDPTYVYPARADWKSNYDASILFTEIPNYITSVTARRPNGEIYYFTLSNGQYTPDSDITNRLTPISNGWSYALRDGSIETYDTNGKLLAITDPSGLSQTLSYDAGKLATVSGPFGHTLTFGYDANGRLSTLTDPSGDPAKVIRYTYNTKNNLTRVDYPDATAKIYHYENTSFPNHLTGISFVDAQGVTTRYSTYAYDTAGKAIRTEHAQTDNGSAQERFILNYDSATQTTVTDPVGMNEVMTFTTNLGVKNLTAKVNQSDSKSVQQTFDTNNNLTCRKDEENRVTTYTYNATNQRTGMTEGLTGNCTSPVTTAVSRATSYQYLSPTLDLPTGISSLSVASGQTKSTGIQYTDAAHPNLPTVITQGGFTPSGTPVSRAVTLDYNASGQVNVINGPRTDVSDITTLEYYECTTGGGCGQLKKITNALGHITTYDLYDANGRLIRMTDPNGLVTTYSYDARGRLRFLTQTPPTGAARVTEYRYTAFGEVAQAIMPDGVILTYAYDAAQDLMTVTDNLGNRIEYRYDLKGNRTTHYTYDPSGTLVRQIDMVYDLRNRLATVNAAGSLTQTVFDAVGNLVRETDPKNNPATQHTPDALNRLVQTIDRLGGQTGYGYDINDRPTQVTPPGKSATRYVYDDLGNLLQETSPDRGTIAYAYDTAGNVKTFTDARNIQAIYSYDALNRLTLTDYPSTTDDITYAYDTGSNCGLGLGRLCTVTDQSGTTQYGYDAFGNISTQIKTELSVTYTTRYTYDAADRISSIVYPDNRLVSYTRDMRGRIQGVNATVNGATQTILSGRAYRADDLFVSQAYGNGLNELRQYDLQGRLTYQSLGSADTRVYTYDPNGNLTQEQRLPQVGNYLYDALDRLSRDQIVTGTTSNQTYTYDGNGNRLTKAATVYSYTSNTNRLTQTGSTALTLDAAGNTLTNGTARYTYNNAGRLRQAFNGTTLKGTYTYNHQLQRTRKVAGTTTTVYHYDLLGNLILETSQTGTVRVAYIYTDTTPVAHIRRASNLDTLSYLHTDHEGTPRLATNATRSVVWRWEGRAFGDTAPTGSVTVNLRYAGQYYDSETGLHYNWNRYYDPKTGRYITSDPIGFAGGLNTYAYVANNPLRYIDPDGLETELIVGGANWYSHVAVRIDNQVYSSGRYPVPGQTTRSLGTIGPDVLTVQNAANYLKEARQWGATGYVLDVNKKQEAAIKTYYEDLIKQAKPHPKRAGWFILSDEYNFVTNNCATLSADALNTGLPWYYDPFVWGASTPAGLEWRIQEAPGLILQKRQY